MGAKILLLTTKFFVSNIKINLILKEIVYPVLI